MPRGPLGFPRLTNLGPLVRADGGRPEGLITKAFIRDKRYFVFQRSMREEKPGNKGNNRVVIGFPKPLSSVLPGYSGSFEMVEEVDGYSEFILLPTDGEGDAHYSGASNKSQIRLNSEWTHRLPFEYPREIGLDIDLVKPETGILVRELRDFEKNRLKSIRMEEYMEIIV